MAPGAFRFAGESIPAACSDPLAFIPKFIPGNVILEAALWQQAGEGYEQARWPG